jgi:hypothetical protein
METTIPSPEKRMDDSQVREANENITKTLQGLMIESKSELHILRHKLSTTYWIIITLSVLMFFLGLVLLSVPIVAAFGGNIKDLTSLIAAGFGVADLTALFLYGPIEKIHNIMGDMSQIILALNSYRSQVGLRLLEMDVEIPSTIGVAADKINAAAENSIKLIQDYFEAREVAK